MRIGLDKITYGYCDILKFFLEKILDRLEGTVRSREDLKFLSEGMAYLGHLWKHVAKNKSTVLMTWIWPLITKGQGSSFLFFSLRLSRSLSLFSTHVGFRGTEQAWIWVSNLGFDRFSALVPR